MAFWFTRLKWFFYFHFSNEFLQVVCFIGLVIIRIQFTISLYHSLLMFLMKELYKLVFEILLIVKCIRTAKPLKKSVVSARQREEDEADWRVLRADCEIISSPITFCLFFSLKETLSVKNEIFSSYITSFNLLSLIALWLMSSATELKASKVTWLLFNYSACVIIFIYVINFQ